MFKSIDVASKPAKQALRIVLACSDALNTAVNLAENAAEKKDLQAAIKSPGFKAECGETSLAGDHAIVVGLGPKADLSADSIRTAAGRACKKLDRIAPKAIVVLASDALFSKSLSAETAGRAFAEGLGLANWRFQEFAGKASKNKSTHATLSIVSSNKQFQAGMTTGLALADATNYAREIAATPPNVCNPSWVASEAKKLAKATGLKCTVLDYATVRKRGMGGIVNVGMGSAAKPCLIMLEHKPAKAAKNITLALVGKTITYDTGGYSLKVNNGMKGMKYDKCGGCAVLGAMAAVASLKLPVHVVGLLPAAENMVSSDSYRPDDIITMYNGITVEVTNTDAEGRLVLADALTYACKDVKATHIVELSTLTGGVVVALGHFCAGVFCNDDRLLERLNAASDSSGEKIWRLPLWPEHKEFMRSQHADLINSNPARSAHPIQGAAFLDYFVDAKTPFAHVDIAGVGNTDKDTDLCAAGPTGFGVRMLADLVESFGR